MWGMGVGQIRGVENERIGQHSEKLSIQSVVLTGKDSRYDTMIKKVI